MKPNPVAATAVTILAALAVGCGSSSAGAPAEGAPGGSSGSAAAGTTGTAGASGGSGSANAGGGGASNHAGAGGSALGGAGQAGMGGQSVNPACVKPSGPDVAAQTYSLPTACFFNPTYGATSMMITDEATFAQTFHCQVGVTSGIDFSTRRLEVAVYTGATSTPTTWVVEGADAIHIGLSPAPSCGGTAPPSQFTLMLLPAGTKPVVQDLCASGCNFGGGGYPA